MTDMGKFDTHGGYFSPQGYLRINEGGSHDENPNGGVRLGVDGQGIPNMLEEGEPVYDDFVYSDNIRADAGMLKKHHIPEKFSGRLFSEIADSFVDEAEERPNDPVSNNGLNAMLVRLANAQEEQKQLEQQEELKEELSKLSPEELEQLEAMLAQQTAAAEQQASRAEAAMVQQEVPQAAAMQDGMQQVPVMADGGFIRRFGDGTPGTIVSEDGMLPEGTALPFNVSPETGGVSGGTLMRVNPETGELVDDIVPARVVAFPGKSREWVEAEVGPRSIRKKIAEGTGQFVRDAYDVAREASLPLYVVPGVGQALAAGDVIHGIATGDYGEAALAALPFVPKIGKGASKFDRKVMTALSDALGGSSETGKAAAKAMKAAKTTGKHKKTKAALKWLGIGAGMDAAGYGAWKAYDIWGNAPSNEVKQEYQIDSDLNNYAHGGPRMKSQWEDARLGYAPGALIEQFPVPEPVPSQDAASVPVTPVKTNAADVWLGGNDWKRGQLYGYYLPPDFDNGRADVPVPYSPEGYATLLRETAASQAQGHTQPPVSKVPVVAAPVTQRVVAAQGAKAAIPVQNTAAQKVVATVPEQSAAAQKVAHPFYSVFTGRTPVSLNVAPLESADRLALSQAAASSGDLTGKVTSRTSATDKARAVGALSTLPRYAGMLMNGAMGLYNAFQEPDSYTYRAYRPVLPTGRMTLIDPVYNPVDEERVINAVLAQNAGDRRAIMNGGMGPSTGATLLASGYNAGRNLGAARLETAAANNDRRNAIITQRNANAAQQAQFQSQLAAQRAQIMNQAQLQNMQNSLMIQRLNDAAEGEKYQALSGNIAAMSKDLAGIGKENFAMNQINTNPYSQYAVAPDGSVIFAPKDAAHGCGGFIKRYRR